jgi:hypothetical protein
VSKALASQLWNPRRAQAMKDGYIELNESDKEEPCVLVHVAKGYIFNENIICNHMIKGDHQL